jgi:hypothetical protein
MNCAWRSLSPAPLVVVVVGPSLALRDALSYTVAA